MRRDNRRFIKGKPDPAEKAVIPEIRNNHAERTARCGGHLLSSRQTSGLVIKHRRVLKPTGTAQSQPRRRVSASDRGCARRALGRHMARAALCWLIPNSWVA